MSNTAMLPVLDIEKPKVCFDLELDLDNSDMWSRGQPVKPKPLPSEKASVADYLKVVMPNARIECLGRTEIVKVGHWFRPTSLFFDTVHHCFQNHYPLALRPEVLMYLIVNEVATTVNLYPEDYRHLFTTSSQKTRIDVRHDGLRKGNPESPWHEALKVFNVRLREHIPSDLASSFLPTFSTATQETMAASTVAFMSAVRKFYDFHTHTLCGLPQIRLLGEATDYTKLREAAEKLAEAFKNRLGLYFQNLIPILRTLEKQAQGAPINQSFWKSIYQFNSNSGADKFNGWISAFVNYIMIAPCRAYSDQPAVVGGIQQKSEKSFDCMQKLSWGSGGIDVGSVPAQVSAAPFQWHYFTEVLPMQFVGGVLGIDNVDGYATPALSYAVAHA